MDGTEDTLKCPVDALFEEARRAGGAAHDFAGDCLRHYQRDCQAALDWQRGEGREAVLRGEDPESVSDQAEARMEDARRRFHERLTMLLEWAANRPSAAPESGGPGLA